MQASNVGRMLTAWVGVRLIRFSIRRLGFASTVRFLTSLPRLGGTAPAPDPRWAAELAAGAGGRYGGSCLDRSVALWFVLHQHGIDGNLRIGVARDGDAIDGHAWVEYRGQVLNDAPEVATRFAVFDDDPVGMVFT
jgi:hypothetical protein